MIKFVFPVTKMLIIGKIYSLLLFKIFEFLKIKKEKNATIKKMFPYTMCSQNFFLEFQFYI